MPHSSAAQPPRILVIDDTPAIHDDFRKLLAPVRHESLAHEEALFAATESKPAATCFELDSAFQGREGLSAVQHALDEGRPYSVAFVDMRMPPGWDGIETTLQLWAVDLHLQIVICTAYSDHSWEETAAKLGGGDNWVILKKPFDPIEMVQLAHALSKKWLVTQRDRHRMANLDEMVRQRTAALVRSDERFLRAFHANPVAVTIQALADGRYLDVNDAFLRLAGRPRADVVQRTPEQLKLWPAADVWCESIRSIEANAPLRDFRCELLASNGDRRAVLVHTASVHLDDQPCILSNIEDITGRLQLEEQLRHSQRMEAVGQLAAGVAHDFNNILTVIQTYSRLACDDPAVPSEHRAGLSEVVAASERAAALTRQLLVFSRRQVTQTRLLDLNATITNVRKMLGRVLPAQITLEWSGSPTIPRVRADEANIEQVVMNLVVNARDALPRGGQIQLGLRSQRFSAADLARHVDAREGKFVCLSVRDNGAGIKPEVLPHIFEPFFTTKGVGEGTGLGLSTVYAIVRQHEGWIEVASALGRGTTFEIFLPAVEQVLGGPVGPVQLKSNTPPRGRGERILFVEDEPAVRNSTRLVLSRSGYNVVEAADAPTALRIWSEQTLPFDLLMTDIVMPNGSNGAELATQLRAAQPALKIVLASGYSRDLLTREAHGLHGARLLQKPYSMDSLLRVLRESLDDTSHERGSLPDLDATFAS